jgi:hypothetical protein
MAKLLHRHGGEVTALTHVGHNTQEGVADWFFVGNVVWFDGSKSDAVEISPMMLCADDAEGHARVLRLSKALNEYLEGAGAWHDAKYKRDGRAYTWTPKAKTGRAELKE